MAQNIDLQNRNYITAIFAVLVMLVVVFMPEKGYLQEVAEAQALEASEITQEVEAVGEADSEVAEKPEVASEAEAISEVEGASEDILVNTKTVIYDNFVRIVFYLNDVDNLHVTAAQDVVSIALGENMKVDIKPILAQLEGYILGAEVNKNYILLKLKDANSKIRKIVGDDFVGIDIIGEISPITSANAQENTEDSDNADEPKTVDISEKSPSAEEGNAQNALQNDELGQVPAQQKSSENEPKEISKNSPKTTKKTRKKARENLSNVNLDSVEIERERIYGGIKLMFKWRENSAAAIFIRNNYIWAIFNKVKKLKTSKIKGIKYIDSTKQISHRDYSILRIKLNDDFVAGYNNQPIKISSFKDDFTWNLEIRGDTQRPEKQEEFEEVNTEVATSPEDSEDDSEREFSYIPENVVEVTRKKKDLFLSVINIAEPLEKIDFEVGDEMVIIPLYENSTAMYPRRNLIDLTMLQTAQGIVFIKKSSNFRYKVKHDGVQIYSSSKLNITPNLYKSDDDDGTLGDGVGDRDQKIVLIDESVFPFDTSKKPDDFDFVKEKNRLYMELSEVAPEKKTLKRLEIAKFFFINQLYAESLGVLREVKALDVTYKAMQEVDLMIAICRYMLEHYYDALREFTKLSNETIEQDNHAEVTFWKWASFYQLNKINRKKDVIEMPIDYIESYDKFMQRYPYDLRYHLGLMAVEEKIEKGNIKTAKTILEIISYDKIPEKYKNHTDFLWAKFEEEAGRIDEAEAIWQRISEDVDDRYNRARASFELAKLRLVHGKIDVDEAVEIFDQIGIVWRGDRLEINLLKLIGQLYIKKEDYYNGLKAWRVLVANFPTTREAVLIAGKMKKTFISLFDKGKAYELSPFEALTLYFEFRELTPVGQRGDRIIQQLSEHFVKADLLDNAAALLLHQIKFRTIGEKKNSLAIKLANLQLENNKPDLAAEAIKYIIDDDASENTKQERDYVKARINVRVGDLYEVQKILDGVFTKTAQDIRLDMFWEKKNWFGIINIIETRLKKYLDTAPFPLKKSEEKDIMRLAVAYGTQEDRDKLRQLQKDFHSRFKEKKLQNVFDFVTHDIKSIDHKNFNATVQLDDIESFMTEYAFWPGKNWSNVISVLEPKMHELSSGNVEITNDDRLDIVRLALSYAMLISEDNDTAEAQKSLGRLNANFRQVTIDRNTISALSILDDKFVKMKDDAVFEGEIALIDIPALIEQYIAAQSISELNIAIK